MSDYNSEEYSSILEAIEVFEQSLLDYDETISNNENNPAQIHIIFRNAHNLKGALALAQLGNSQGLIHIIEDRFDQVRNGKASVSSDFIDKSLKSLDIITKSITNSKENPEDFTELKLALTNINNTDLEKPILPFELSDSEKDIALLKCKEESGFFIIEKLIKSSIDKSSYIDLPIFRDVEENGTLIGFRPEWENLNRKSDDDIISIFFATKRSEEDLFFIIFDPIKKLNTTKICSSLSIPYCQFIMRKIKAAKNNESSKYQY